MVSQKNGEAISGRPATNPALQDRDQDQERYPVPLKKAGAHLRKIWGRRKAPGSVQKAGKASRPSGGKEAR